MDEFSHSDMPCDGRSSGRSLDECQSLGCSVRADSVRCDLALDEGIAALNGLLQHQQYVSGNELTQLGLPSNSMLVDTDPYTAVAVRPGVADGDCESAR
jgi:hypothetical protein